GSTGSRSRSRRRGGHGRTGSAGRARRSAASCREKPPGRRRSRAPGREERPRRRSTLAKSYWSSDERSAPSRRALLPLPLPWWPVVYFRKSGGTLHLGEESPALHLEESETTEPIYSTEPRRASVRTSASWSAS